MNQILQTLAIIFIFGHPYFNLHAQEVQGVAKIQLPACLQNYSALSALKASRGLSFKKKAAPADTYRFLNDVYLGKITSVDYFKYKIPKGASLEKIEEFLQLGLITNYFCQGQKPLSWEKIQAKILSSSFAGELYKLQEHYNKYAPMEGELKTSKHLNDSKAQLQQEIQQLSLKIAGIKEDISQSTQDQTQLQSKVKDIKTFLESEKVKALSDIKQLEKLLNERALMLQEDHSSYLLSSAEKLDRIYAFTKVKAKKKRLAFEKTLEEEKKRIIFELDLEKEKIKEASLVVEHKKMQIDKLMEVLKEHVHLQFRVEDKIFSIPSFILHFEPELAQYLIATVNWAKRNGHDFSAPIAISGDAKIFPYILELIKYKNKLSPIADKDILKKINYWTDYYGMPQPTFNQTHLNQDQDFLFDVPSHLLTTYKLPASLTGVPVKTENISLLATAETQYPFSHYIHTIAPQYSATDCSDFKRKIIVTHKFRYDTYYVNGSNSTQLINDFDTNLNNCLPAGGSWKLWGRKIAINTVDNRDFDCHVSWHLAYKPTTTNLSQHQLDLFIIDIKEATSLEKKLKEIVAAMDLKQFEFYAAHPYINAETASMGVKLIFAQPKPPVAEEEIAAPADAEADAEESP